MCDNFIIEGSEPSLGHMHGANDALGDFLEFVKM